MADFDGVLTPVAEWADIPQLSVDAIAMAGAGGVMNAQAQKLANRFAALGAAGGSARVGFQPTGTGAVARTAADKLREIVSVKDFGAVGDGVADDASEVQAAENYLLSVGGGILLFPRGTYAIGSGLLKRSSNILWQGEGKGNEHDAGSGRDATTALVWTGPAGGTMIDFAPTSGASNRRISGGGIVGMGLYGQSSAAVGLSIKSVMNAKIDVYVEGFTTTAVDMNVVATLGEAKDCRDNAVFINGKQVGASDGILLRLGGDTSANVCYNEIHLRGQYKFATALVCGNSDNNEIWQWTYRFGGGSAKGTECLGGSVDLLTSRANTWHQCYAGDGGFFVYGTGDGYAVASTRNRCLDWDNDNTQPAPTIGTAASFTWTDKDGKHVWTDVKIEHPQANRLEYATASGARLVRMTFSASADSWLTIGHGVGSASLVAGSDNANAALGISTRGTGQGDLYNNGFAARSFSWSSVGIAFNGNTPIAKPTITGSKAGNAALTSIAAALHDLGLVTNSTT